MYLIILIGGCAVLGIMAGSLGKYLLFTYLKLSRGWSIVGSVFIGGILGASYGWILSSVTR